MLLGERPSTEQLADTPQRLNALLGGFATPDWAREYAPGKWNAAQILCHLADTELVFGYRLRQTLAEESHVMQSFDQDLWASVYDRLEGSLALATFIALRAWNVALLRRLTPDELVKTTSHLERGIEDINLMTKMFAGHDINHLNQIEIIARAR